MSYNDWLYVYSNPANLSDPSGHDPWWCESSNNSAQCITNWIQSQVVVMTGSGSIPLFCPDLDTTPFTHKGDPIPGTGKTVRYGGEYIHSLFVDFQSHGGWWNNNLQSKFGIEEFLGMYLLFESNSNMTMANILVTITAQNLFVGGFNPPTCSLGGQCFNAVFNFISANIDGKSGLLAGSQNASYAQNTPKLGNEAEIRHKISTLGRNALSPSSVIIWDRYNGPSSWGNSVPWKRALIDHQVWEGFNGLSPDKIYYYVDDAIFYTFNQHLFWKDKIK